MRTGHDNGIAIVDGELSDRIDENETGARSERNDAFMQSSDLADTADAAALIIPLAQRLVPVSAR